MRYAILIPARDEAETLPRLFEEIRRAPAPPPATIVVVDNASEDGTAAVAASFGASVVREERPGYGQACQAGIARLRRESPVPDAVVFLDADDYLAPSQLGTLLDPIAADEADLVIGERAAATASEGVRWHARLGNRFVLRVLRRAYGSDVRDMGPFRAIRWRVLDRLALDDPDYGWYVQMQVRALRAGSRVIGVPVRFRRRTAGRSKVSGSVVASLRAGWAMLRTLAVEIGRRRPVRAKDAEVGGAEGE